jgi:hypothetical protein
LIYYGLRILLNLILLFNLNKKTSLDDIFQLESDQEDISLEDIQFEQEDTLSEQEDISLEDYLAEREDINILNQKIFH